MHKSTTGNKQLVKAVLAFAQAIVSKTSGQFVHKLWVSRAQAGRLYPHICTQPNTLGTTRLVYAQESLLLCSAFPTEKYRHSPLFFCFLSPLSTVPIETTTN
jgi:hypothetical protein